ncbi:MAG TPA: alpha/beta hydrolase [Steroidobacteraceae bacterium]|nr:alpha/beta hydrolase [Steroidobacteraceae bacterium]
MTAGFTARMVAAALLIAAGCERAGPHVEVMESSVTTGDGVRLYYRVAGSGTQTIIAPFALYHGTALDRLAKGRRIVTFDPRGRGASDPVSPEDLSLDHLLDDLDAVRRAVGAEKVTLLGWSGGGMEGFAYALRHPGRVERIIQLAPVAARFDPYGRQMMDDRGRRTDAAAIEEFRARVGRGEFAGDSAGQCRARTRITDPATFADPARMPEVPDVCVHRNEHDDLLGPYFGKLFEFIDGYDYRARLAEVAVPRLVIHGAADNTPLEGNREWVAGQPNARILVIEGAGHWPHYEKPDETLAAIETFLAGDWPAGAQAVP